MNFCGKVKQSAAALGAQLCMVGNIVATGIQRVGNKAYAYGVATLSYFGFANFAAAQTVDDTDGTIAGKLTTLYSSAATTAMDWVFSIVAACLVLGLVVGILNYARKMLGARKAA